MKKYLVTTMLAAALIATACVNAPIAPVATTTTGSVVTTPVLQTPEGQIKFGADTVASISVTATGLLRSNVLTLPQAEGVNLLLHGASDALDKANVMLVDCRKRTGTTSATNPDPCKPGVNDLIVLSLDTIVSVKRTLDVKK